MKVVGVPLDARVARGSLGLVTPPGCCLLLLLQLEVADVESRFGRTAYLQPDPLQGSQQTGDIIEGPVFYVHPGYCCQDVSRPQGE